MMDEKLVRVVVDDQPGTEPSSVSDAHDRVRRKVRKAGVQPADEL